MLGFQLKSKPLRKKLANFGHPELRICQHCHKRQVVFQAIKETVLFKTCDETSSFSTITLCHFERIPVLCYERKIFRPYGKLKVNRHVPKRRQGVSGECFCCSPTRKGLLDVTSDAFFFFLFFGAAKSCTIK